MFSKILIANRGEIAARVISTARRLGVRTVAVYSDADAGAQHVALADEAVRIGPPPVAESYLLGDAIIAAALATGAQAIHPGYGFLSENPEFVEAVEAAGLTFIGPPASAIRAMGLKDAAKALMEQANVPVVPGYHGAGQNAEDLAKEAGRIGYPVLIKARAGGGGKGMRRVDDAADFAEALASAAREGQASFGDPAVLIEKYITTPRHVEIQVFADGQGNVVHLFERDCSLQRRHQKVIEEAPAPDMPEAVRAAMGQAAVEAARAIGYEGAGTVEFICDGTGPLHESKFWFMEMNTRLQVEHPVTEAITGLDLVELQLRVAFGEALPFAQEDLTITGHAFEARVYAEDPTAGFLPAIGTLDHLEFPEGTAFGLGETRIDSGVRAGDAITPFYDPMIAKIITHGATRSDALTRLGQALAAVEVAGLTTNLSFLSRLAAHPDFAAGKVDTGLIERNFDTLTTQPAPSPIVTAFAQLAAANLLEKKGKSDPWDQLKGWRSWGPATITAPLLHGDTSIDTSITIIADGYQIGDLTLTIHPLGAGRYRVTSDHHQTTLSLHQSPNAVTVFADGETFRFTIPDPLNADLSAANAGDSITAPMPGLVAQLNAAPGDIVTQGAVLVVLEAMKMEHALTAPRDGTLATVSAALGDQVTQGTVLIELVTEE